MLTKIDAQMEGYDARVGNSLQMISADAQGRISVQDLEKALAVIKHKPDDQVGQAVIQKLDVDKDGFVELEHVLGLVREEGLGELPFRHCELCAPNLVVRCRGRRRRAINHWTREGDQKFRTSKRGYRAGTIAFNGSSSITSRQPTRRILSIVVNNHGSFNESKGLDIHARVSKTDTERYEFPSF